MLCWDRVIASRQADRPIGEELCFPKAYQRLLEAVKAPPEERPQLLRNYLDDWFSSLKGAGSPNFPREHRTPYWWDFCANKELGMKGGYFGCWCIEAVVAAKVFNIDDSLCLDHPNYPGDLLQDGRGPRHSNPAVAPGQSQDSELEWRASTMGRTGIKGLVCSYLWWAVRRSRSALRHRGGVRLGPMGDATAVRTAGDSPDTIVMGAVDTRAPTGSLFTVRPGAASTWSRPTRASPTTATG